MLAADIARNVRAVFVPLCGSHGTQCAGRLYHYRYVLSAPIGDVLGLTEETPGPDSAGHIRAASDRGTYLSCFSKELSVHQVIGLHLLMILSEVVWQCQLLLSRPLPYPHPMSVLARHSVSFSVEPAPTVAFTPATLQTPPARIKLPRPLSACGSLRPFA